MVVGLAAISDMSTGVLVDPIVSDYQAQQAAAQATAAKATTPTASPLLWVALLGGGAYAWYKYGDRIKATLKGGLTQ